MKPNWPRFDVTYQNNDGVIHTAKSVTRRQAWKMKRKAEAKDSIVLITGARS